MTNTALGINASSGTPSYAALAFRQAMSALVYNGTARVLGTTSGYAVGRQPATLTATGTTWTIGAFAAIIDPAFTTTQASYFCATDANNTGSVTAADATNPRIDILYAQVSDTDIDSSGSRTFTVAYLAGTPAGSPSAPATPARSFKLATINVPQSGGGSPTIAANGAFAVANGGILPVASSAAYPASPVEGMYVDDAALDALLRYNGSAWKYITKSRASYVPALSAVSGSPAVGNATIVAHYEVVGGRCFFTIDFTVGSTTNMGHQGISLGLPLTAAASGAFTEAGTALMVVSGGAVYPGTAQISSGGTTVQVFGPSDATHSGVFAIQHVDATGSASTGIPVVSGNGSFNTGAIIRINGNYPI